MLFIKMNSLWLIIESIKPLEIKTSTLLNLDFANDVKGAQFLNITFLLVLFGSIKALEIKTSTLLNLDFANDNILSCFFFFFLTI